MIEKAALLDSINPTASQVLIQAGIEVVTYPKDIEAESFAELTSSVGLVGVRSGPALTPELLNDSIEVITVFGVGTNHIVRHAEGGKGADDKGVAIFNSAHENTRSVAELVIGNAFALTRGIAQHNHDMHNGVWTKQDGLELRGKTMGIIGYGAIGGQVSVMAESIGMDVVYYDPAPQIPPQGRAKLLEDMEQVLAVSDVLTLHTPGGSSNKNMINDETLKQMKPGSFLINAARADLVDYQAVARALDSGQLGGIAVDVFEKGNEKEPSKKGKSFDHILRGVDNVILTPHIGGSTVEAQRNIGAKVAERAVNYLRTGSTMGSVNIPNLALGNLQPGHCRLLNIHHNQPGVMAHLTALVAEAGLNLVETKQTVNGELGYVAFEVEGIIPEDALTVMRALHATYRARVIA